MGLRIDFCNTMEKSLCILMTEMSGALRHSFFLLLLGPPQFATACLPGEDIPEEKQPARAVPTCLRCKVQQFSLKCWRKLVCVLRQQTSRRDACRCSTLPGQLQWEWDRRDSWRACALNNLSAICQAVSALVPGLKEWANCFVQGINASVMRNRVPAWWMK